MTESKKMLSKHDLNKMAWDSLMLQNNFNYERMQGTGFAAAMAPTLKKIYGNDTKALGESLVDHSKFFNSSPALVPFVMGIIASMEEERAPRDAVNAVKNSLFPPLAGIGDALVWFTALPLAAGIGCSIAANGNFLGVIVFMAIMVAVNCLKWPTAHWGYQMGTKALEVLGSKLGKISMAASMVGVTVLGALIASYVAFSFTLEIPLTDTYSFNLQADLFDNIFPNIVPAGLTAAIYWLYKKRKVKPVALIIGVLVFCIICAYLGVA